MGDRRLMARGRVRGGAEPGGRAAAGGCGTTGEGSLRGNSGVARRFGDEAVGLPGSGLGCAFGVAMGQAGDDRAPGFLWTGALDGGGGLFRAGPSECCGGLLELAFRGGLTGGGHRRPDGVCGRQRFVSGGSGGGPLLRAQAGVTEGQTTGPKRKGCRSGEVKGPGVAGAMPPNAGKAPGVAGLPSIPVSAR